MSLLTLIFLGMLGGFIATQGYDREMSREEKDQMAEFSLDDEDHL